MRVGTRPDKEFESDGLFRLDLEGGPPGRSSITVRAKNSHRVAFPFSAAEALADTESVTAQLFGGDSPTCFSVTLDQVTAGQLTLAKDSLAYPTDSAFFATPLLGMGSVDQVGREPRRHGPAYCCFFICTPQQISECGFPSGHGQGFS